MKSTTSLRMNNAELLKMTARATTDGTRLPAAAPPSIKCKNKPLMEGGGDRVAEECEGRFLPDCV